MDSPQRLNIHRHLVLDYGRDCLKKFRELEICERTIATRDSSPFGLGHVNSPM